MRLKGRLAAASDDRHRLRVEDELNQMLSVLGLDDTYRLTAFRHWREDRVFSNLGRGAANPLWRQRRRPAIPDDQGVLAQALDTAEGYAAVEDLPGDRADYDQRMREMRLTEEDIRNLTMRPRSIAAFPVPDHARGHPQYFLTVESKQPMAFSADGVVQALLGDRRHLLSHLGSVLASLKDDEANPKFPD